MQIEKTLSKSPHNSDAQKKVLDELEAHSEEVYIKLIYAGFRHLIKIQNYPDWNAVVAKNASLGF